MARRYAMLNGKRVLIVKRKGKNGHVVRWTALCSGCCQSDGMESFMGDGCRECGGTGKRRRAQWVPLLVERR